MNLPKSFLLMLVLIFGALHSFSQENNNSKDSNQKIDSANFEITGTIMSKNGVNVNIKIISQSILPSKEKVGTLSKYFEEKVFGFNTTGWLDIGKTKVIAVKSNIITLQIIEEHSVITKNDKKVDNFKIGATVKFEWQ